MKKYEVKWIETRTFECSVIIEAEDSDSALDIACFIDGCDKEEEIEGSNFIEWVSCEEK